MTGDLNHRPRAWRLLSTSIAVLGGVAILTGLVGVVGGLAIAPGEPTAPFLDSEYRFVNAIWLMVGIALAWSLREPFERAAVTRFVLVAIVLGGLSRLVSFALQGIPYPAFIVSLAIELIVVPALLVWHVRVVKARRDPA